MSLGFNTRGNLSTSGRTTASVYLGSMRGAGSINRKYNFCKKTCPDYPLFCLFGIPKPVPPPPSPAYTFYYNKSNIQNFKSVNFDTELVNSLNYQKYQQTNLYNQNFDSILGNIFYDITISNTLNLGVYDLEKSYLTVSGTNESMLTFTISLFNTSEAGYLNSGLYIFEITGGTGQFLNSKGYVKFTVINYLRKLEIFLE